MSTQKPCILLLTERHHLVLTANIIAGLLKEVPGHRLTTFQRARIVCRCVYAYVRVFLVTANVSPHSVPFIRGESLQERLLYSGRALFDFDILNLLGIEAPKP